MNAPSPYKNTNKRIGVIVLGVSSVFSLLILALLYAIGDKDPVEIKSTKSKEIIDLLQTPTTTTSSNRDASSPDVGLELPSGGWVQQTNSHGELSQQYRCESLDPNPPLLPDGWIEMQKPEVELYLSDNKLVVITGDVGIANAPKRNLESGEISGHVNVSMYELGTNNNRAGLSPTMVLTTPQANFDNFIGEITCDSEVRVVSDSQTLVGRQLSIRFNDLEERVEYLRLNELDYLEFYPENSKPFQPIQTPKPTAKTNTNTKTKINSSLSKQTTNPNKIQASAVGPEVEHYLLSFQDNVQVLQGDQHSGRYATGDLLTVAFSNDSDSVSSSPSMTNTRASTMFPSGFQTTIIATALATAPTATNELPIRVTCSGGLTMVPLEDVSLMPSSAEDTRFELIANENSSVLLIDNQEGLTANGSKLRYQLKDDRSDLFGSPATFVMNDTSTLSNHLWISRTTGKGGAVGEGSSTSNTPKNNTTLTWKEGVDFLFDAEGEDGALQKVICNGDVVLTDDNSTVACTTLKVSFNKAPDGSSSPDTAFATGNVKAVSETQTLWSDEARVTFKPSDLEQSDDDSMFGNSKADTMHADGNVQVLLDDGGRAFCDVLDGNIAQDSVLLTGNVVIAYKRMLMNKGDKATLTLDRNAGKGRWEGAGQALFLDLPLDVSSDKRIERPQVSKEIPESDYANNISMRANWDESMLLDRTFNNDAGAVDLNGNVDVRSQRNLYERSSMTGENLRLEFKNTESSESEDERELQTVIAKDDAQIEHRLWDKTKLDEKPVVYYIGGNHIEFEAETFDTLAVGEGVLLLRDPREPSTDSHQSSLAGRGITRFTWDEKLKTTKINETLYRIQMNGNVQMHHKGLNGEVGRLTSTQIDAIATDPNQVKKNPDGSSELTLRGMDLQQLQATGNVYVKTQSRAVDCDYFDYNLRTGIAKLTANNYKTVSILTDGSPYPVRASSIVWNMDPSIDTITILGLQGSSPN